MATRNVVDTTLAGQTGTGQFVGDTSPTLVTPALGTPSSGTLTSCTGLPLTTGVTGILGSSNGGTGVNNGSSTLTLSGNLTTNGAFSSTFTMTGATGVTFPTSGTLATTAQIPTGAALTKTDDTNVTLTLGGSPTTALVNAASLTLGWTGQLAVTRGGTGVSTSTGTGSVVLSNSPTVTGLTSDQITWSDTTKGIVGTTTNNNAATGYVGEFVSANVPGASAVSCTNGVSRDITSIALTAGDWDVTGNVRFTPSGVTSLTYTCWTSATSATQPDVSLMSAVAIVGNAVAGLVTPLLRVSIASTTTIYLSCNAAFAGGGSSVTACGSIFARRIR